jgi:hypothetical protein
MGTNTKEYGWSFTMNKKKAKQKVKKKKRPVCKHKNVKQGGAEVYCDDCGFIFYA